MCAGTQLDQRGLGFVAGLHRWHVYACMCVRVCYDRVG